MSLSKSHCGKNVKKSELQKKILKLHKNGKMGSLTISSKILDKYFGYLKNLDNTAKKNLIIKLTKSIETESRKKTELKSFFGAWEDNRDSDEIISEIKASRINKVNTESFE